MPSLTARFENFIGSHVLSSVRRHDNKLLMNSPAFTHIAPTLEVTSPECGHSGSPLDVAHTSLGANRFPRLTWHRSRIETHIGTATTVNMDDRHVPVAEYLVIVEDPDAPYPDPVVHCLYFGIRPSKMSLFPSDFDEVLISPPGEESVAVSGLRGGFQYGLNRGKCIWSAPRPTLGHGVHRYFFQVVGLSKHLKVDEGVVLSKDILRKTLTAKDIVCWGVWVGKFERKFGRNGE
ncbi:MAG: hypothetical protein LQ345_000711 [Seirophora villosa]|nr:MAG: hypothetical protein LQ345_003799 [Seirophora villosa]KAI4119376.1 MAG: hypothetical protein LQ345_000711 [Seirophora villosa]